MAKLENIIEETSGLQLYGKDGLSSDYRLWLISNCGNCFPTTILHKSIKCAINPLKGVKRNMKKIFNELDERVVEEYKSTKENPNWNKLFMGLVFFHSILLERTRYQSFAWNGICQFYDDNLEYCKRALRLENPLRDNFDCLKRTTLENYCNNITDLADKECIKTLLEKFYNNEMLSSHYNFYPDNPAYSIPSLPSITKCMEFIDQVICFL